MKKKEIEKEQERRAKGAYAKNGIIVNEKKEKIIKQKKKRKIHLLGEGLSSTDKGEHESFNTILEN